MVTHHFDLTFRQFAAPYAHGAAADELPFLRSALRSLLFLGLHAFHGVIRNRLANLLLIWLDSKELNDLSQATSRVATQIFEFHDQKILARERRREPRFHVRG